MDAAVARRFLVLADREEIAAEHRFVQHDAHDERDDDESDQAVRNAVEAAGGQPLQRREARAERKPRRRVLGIVAGDAAVDEQAAERHHERLQPELGDKETVQQPDQAADRHHDDEGKTWTHGLARHEVDENHAEQRDDRADRQLDAARDDHEGLRHGEYAEQADQVRRARQVDRRQEARIDDRHHRSDDDDEDEEPEVFSIDHRRKFPAR
jgi:hypothetical protein